MTLKQKLFKQYRMYYRVWFELDWKERNEDLDIGEAVATAHTKGRMSEALQLIREVLSKKDQEMLNEIASEEVNKVYEEKLNGAA